MGRTNLIILGLGAGACVILSLLMQHAVKATKERHEAPVIAAMQSQFGSRFNAPPKFHVERRDDGVRVAELVVYPHIARRPRRVVQAVGTFCWHQQSEGWEFDALVVVADDGLGRRTRYAVPSPRDLGSKLRVLRDDEEPDARPRREPAPKPTSRPTSMPSAEEAKHPSK